MSSDFWARLGDEMTANLDASTLSPPRVSLLSAADIVPVPVADREDPDKPRRWESGFQVWTEGCEVSYMTAICPPEDEIKDSDGGGERITYRPYVVFATDKCSTFSNRDFYGRATRKLILAESTRLESELWLGAAGGNPALVGWTNADGAQEPTTITPANGTLTPVQGLALLDQALGDCSSGRGMIHIRPVLLPALLEAKAVRREGNVYLSPMDNIVVPGRGYPGTGPTGQAVGQTEWMFANTGIVQVRHSEIVFTPPQSDLAAQHTWTTNDRLVYAERVTHVALDPTCCVLALQVAAIELLDEEE